ncbi:hypothetical protein D9623_20485 [Azospirillum brasilense]|uniref:Uncharacterized protein n=1 Tax=Azospirillum brasilense TaxID=192 RepID=A0A4D8R0K0_AZOBR|nr:MULTISPECIES: hypothetical protein [Azospirillum]MDW7553733.1 hypothetical protein [Azospirillum brasilense]MDW7592828.1 hypothetical protein [Azospirillum brasilense]MDW7628359.1 hypothetical protein [Azospirillum brasilense]MDX5952298.1 hypothetical protein [Azospirillum brasilense]NUB12658.1 hypothetical protein [Azospirillum brasilense]
MSAFIATAFTQNNADAAKTQWRQVAEQVRLKLLLQNLQTLQKFRTERVAEGMGFEPTIGV